MFESTTLDVPMNWFAAVTHHRPCKPASPISAFVASGGVVPDHAASSTVFIEAGTHALLALRDWLAEDRKSPAYRLWGRYHVETRDFESRMTCTGHIFAFTCSREAALFRLFWG